jgi:hypothetical protein
VDLIKTALKNPEFNSDDVGTDTLQRLQVAIGSGDLKVIDMHKDGDGPGPQISRQLDWEPAFRNQHVDVALRKDLSPSSLCGSSCGIQQKRVQESRARGAETLQRRRDAAWDMEPGCIDIEHLRYRHTISKVQNVDIE